MRVFRLASYFYATSSTLRMSRVSLILIINYLGPRYSATLPIRAFKLTYELPPPKRSQNPTLCNYYVPQFFVVPCWLVAVATLRHLSNFKSEVTLKKTVGLSNSLSPLPSKRVLHTFPTPSTASYTATASWSTPLWAPMAYPTQIRNA